MESAGFLTIWPRGMSSSESLRGLAGWTVGRELVWEGRWRWSLRRDFGGVWGGIFQVRELECEETEVAMDYWL